MVPTNFYCTLLDPGVEFTTIRIADDTDHSTTTSTVTITAVHRRDGGPACGGHSDPGVGGRNHGSSPAADNTTTGGH